ncbi:MAG: hypothetical protein OXU72_08385 [Gammaproteobacteria bacterium]|nr:hypothetical protein [Gammaproteobacteria bacterium]
MSQESWAVIGTGIALLVALSGLMLTLSTWQRDDNQFLRTEFNQLRMEFQGLRTEFQGLRTEVRVEIGKVRQGQTELRERLARIETTIGIAHPDPNAQSAAQSNSNT